MVVLVFGNVVLRYGFNSGITVSEELSRWLFVWLTFLGAVVALREHAHLGTDTLVARLPPLRQEGLPGARPPADAVRLLAASSRAASSRRRSTWTCWRRRRGCRWPSSTAAGIVFAVSGGVMLLLDLWLLLTGRVADDELVMVQESEDARALQHAEPARPRKPDDPTRPRHHDPRHLPRLAAGRDGDRHADLVRAAGLAASR